MRVLVKFDEGVYGGTIVGISDRSAAGGRFTVRIRYDEDGVEESATYPDPDIFLDSSAAVDAEGIVDESREPERRMSDDDDEDDDDEGNDERPSSTSPAKENQPTVDAEGSIDEPRGPEPQTSDDDREEERPLVASPAKEKQPKVLPQSSAGIERPSDRDVILGRGGGAIAHEGNKRFRGYAIAMKDVYKNDKTTFKEKQSMTRVRGTSDRHWLREL